VADDAPKRLLVAGALEAVLVAPKRFLVSGALGALLMVPKRGLLSVAAGFAESVADELPKEKLGVAAGLGASMPNEIFFAAGPCDSEVDVDGVAPKKDLVSTGLGANKDDAGRAAGVSVDGALPKRVLV
jgi:hypothetical protein